MLRSSSLGIVAAIFVTSWAAAQTQAPEARPSAPADAAPEPQPAGSNPVASAPAASPDAPVPSNSEKPQGTSSAPGMVPAAASIAESETPGTVQLPPEKATIPAARVQAPAAAKAATAPAQAGTLSPIVVTANKIAEPQSEVTQSVRVLDEDEVVLCPSNQRNASELIRYEPGVFISPLSRNDANWGSYGGLGPKYNTYLLDGLPIDAFVDTTSLDPWAFERVESQRGPASVMYSNYLSSDFAGQQSPLAGGICRGV